MSGDVLINAKTKRKQLLARKAELRREREAVDAQLQDVEKFLALYSTFSKGEQEHLPNFGTESGPESPRLIRARTNSDKEDVADAARVVIARHGQPVMRADLFRELIELGLKIDGKDPEMVLSTMLWRQKDKVVRLKKGGGYWLPERPWEPAGYEPTEEALEQARRRREADEARDAMLAFQKTREEALEECGGSTKH